MANTLRLNLSGKIGAAGAAPQQSVDAAGMRGKGIAAIGQGIVKAGSEIGGLVERREIADAKNVVFFESGVNKAQTKFEIAKLKKEFEDNPEGFADALEKVQSARQKKALKRITNPKAKPAMEKEFKLSRFESAIEAQTFKAEQNLSNSLKDIEDIANIKGADAFLEPRSGTELVLDMKTDIFHIINLDTTDRVKLKAQVNYTNTMTEAALEGYMRGGDFRSAKSVLKTLAETSMVTASGKEIPILNAKQITRLSAKIDTRKRQFITQTAKAKKLRKENTERDFEASKGKFKQMFSSIAADPNQDLSGLVNTYKARNLINKNIEVNIRSIKTMDSVDSDKSQDLLNTTFQNIAGSDEPARFKSSINDLVFSGAMSAEHGLSALRAIDAKINTKFGTERSKLANSMIEGAIRPRRGKRATARRNTVLTKIKEEAGELQELKNYDPVYATEIVLQERGLLNPDNIQKINLGSKFSNRSQFKKEDLPFIKNEIARRSLLDSEHPEYIDSATLAKYRDILIRSESSIKPLPSLEKARQPDSVRE